MRAELKVGVTIIWAKYSDRDRQTQLLDMSLVMMDFPESTFNDNRNDQGYYNNVDDSERIIFWVVGSGLA